MNKRFTQLFATIILAGILFGCTKDNISYRYPDNQDYARQNRAGSLLSKHDLVIFDDEKQTSAEFKTSSLWNASVDVISSLFPIALIDANSGIITSQWQEKGETRVKINAFIKGDEITKDNIRISVFYQKKTPSGEWQIDANKNNSPNSLSAQRIQDKILQKAREI